MGLFICVGGWIAIHLVGVCATEEGPNRRLDYPACQEAWHQDASHVLLLSAPENYERLLDPLPTGFVFENQVSPSVDSSLLRRKIWQSISGRYESSSGLMPSYGSSWPKKSAKVASTVTEDTIREVGLPLGFVDVKVCAINEVWSGLKLVVRNELR